MNCKWPLLFVLLFNLDAVHAQSKLEFMVNTMQEDPQSELTGSLYLNGQLESKKILFATLYEFEVERPTHLILFFPGFEPLDTVLQDKLSDHIH